MAVFFLFGLRKREVKVEGFTGIDLSMSQALKGIACVLILMGHFCSRLKTMSEATPFSTLVYMTTANVALSLFMYFSGYGLSVKPKNGGGYLTIWYKRIKKVYIPLLLVCFISMALYVVLPVKFSIEESETLQVSKDIIYIHNFSPNYLKILFVHLFGWNDWYVLCIMIFYSLYYLSLSLTKNNPSTQTFALWLMMVAYFIFAFIYFGKAEAHWYRYCWTFFLGHVHGKVVQIGKTNRWDLSMLLVLFGTILFEALYMKLSYFMAIFIIVLCSIINKKYLMHSSLLAFMGGISYFFYLSHERIGYLLISYINCHSVIAWVALCILISMVLKKMYSQINRILTVS